jgi:nucleoside-diphosphate-sugar epimerase
MRAVVTGATGCIGAVLCRELQARGWRVRALVRPGRKHAHIAGFVAEIHTGDISTPESLKGLAEGADVVFHLAARVTDHGSRRQFHDAILEGTRNVLQASEGEAGRFVQVSSTTACGVGRHLQARKEDDPCFRSGVPYSDAKLEAEALVGLHGDRFPGGFTIVRPSNVIGPGSPYVDEVCRRFLSPLGVPLIDRGRHSASLIYVDNLVDGIIRAGTHPKAAGRTYHFCDDWQVSWKRYLTDLSAFLGKTPKGDIPFRLAWAMGHVLENVCAPFGLRPPVTRLAAAIMGRDNHVDTSRAQTELGWLTQVSYADAMQQIGSYVSRIFTQRQP